MSRHFISRGIPQLCACLPLCVCVCESGCGCTSVCTHKFNYKLMTLEPQQIHIHFTFVFIYEVSIRTHNGVIIFLSIAVVALGLIGLWNSAELQRVEAHKLGFMGYINHV